jgi:hypothetical protein
MSIVKLGTAPTDEALVAGIALDFVVAGGMPDT